MVINISVQYNGGFLPDIILIGGANRTLYARKKTVRSIREIPKSSARK